MSMARHELTVVSTKVLGQLNSLRLVVVVSKACHPRAWSAQLIHRHVDQMMVGICRVKCKKESHEIHTHPPPVGVYFLIEN